MTTKTQKNFRKEMKKFQRQRKKLGEKEPLSYIYQNEYTSETRGTARFFSSMLSFIIRIAFFVGLLSITGIVDPLIKNFQRATQIESVSQQLVTNVADNQGQILFDYLDQYDGYTKKSQEIIDRYYNGRLETIEVYALQKVLMDSIVFTEEIQDDFLFGLNEAIVLYHNELINWLTVLVNPNQKDLNTSIQNLRWSQQEVMNELVKTFETIGIGYNYQTDGGISYERIGYSIK